MSLPTRREILGWLAACAVAQPAFADDRPCYPPRYNGWTARRESWWPEKIGQYGFVNYYGEAYKFDAAIGVPRDRVPSCSVWGADATTLDTHVPVRQHLKDLEVGGLPASTDCYLWQDENTRDFDAKIATLYATLHEACPAPKGRPPVRFFPVGSHHSSSDVYKRPDDDIRAVVVRVDGLNHVLLERPEWKPRTIDGGGVTRDGAGALALVGAGLTVCQLNEALWDKGLALNTQGSFDGQSLAGAISTGTHGAGAEHGAIADSVEAVLLAACLKNPETGVGEWQLLQIEPAPERAITEPARFVTERAGVRWKLIQDNELFDAVVVGMGTMGVILAYVMRVRSAYFLREFRVGRPWSEVSQNLVERATTPASGFSGNGWRYELVVNPGAVTDENLDWVCTEVYRDSWEYDLDYLAESREVPDKWMGDFTRNVNLGGQIGQFVTSAANDALSKGRRVGLFADRCYRVLKLGQGEFVQAWGSELMVPAERGAEMISWLLKKNPESGQFRRGKRRDHRLLNPFGVRFARGRRGYLSPTRRWHDGEPQLTCTLEITEAVKDTDRRNLGEQKNGKPTSKSLIEWWADEFVTQFGEDARLHWGQLQGHYGPEDLARSYPAHDIDRWYAAYRFLNPFGLFDTAFAKRVGFVARRDADGSPLPTYQVM